MTYKDIAGQWCGDVTDYVFTPNTLTVKFHDDKPPNAFKITKYTYTNYSVSIDWVNAAGKASVTVFGEFGGKPITMAQQQNGDNVFAELLKHGTTLGFRSRSPIAQAIIWQLRHTSPRSAAPHHASPTGPLSPDLVPR